MRRIDRVLVVVIVALGLAVTTQLFPGRAPRITRSTSPQPHVTNPGKATNVEEDPHHTEAEATAAPRLREVRGWGDPYPPLRQSATPCTEQRHTAGAWVHNASLEAEYPAVGKILGSCERGFAKEFPGRRRPELEYQWRPERCELLPWSVETFCRALRGRDLMMAGDSLTDYWHASLFYRLGGRGDIYATEGTGRGKHRCKGHAVCQAYYPERPPKIHFYTNQLLSERHRSGRNFAWHRFLKQHSLLLLNSGSWMVDPLDEKRPVSDDEYMQHMRRAVQLVKQSGFKGTVIWRTTYKGHPYCWKDTAPLVEEQHTYPTVPPWVRYRWDAIPGRNRRATQLWRDEGAVVMDVAAATNRMPLGHIGKYHYKPNATDCLHYCSPGAAYEHWSELLMNILAGNA